MVVETENNSHRAYLFYSFEVPKNQSLLEYKRRNYWG